jgi:flagellar biosynthesis chaperone FliJ
MAVLPKKFEAGRGTDRDRIAALERYIKYLEERIEAYATSTNKKIEEVKRNVDNDQKAG